MRHPMVSSLVVSRPERMGFLPAAVAGWLAQTWDRNELVIAWSGPEDEASVKASLGLLDRGDVRVVPTPSDATLGARRNASIDAARGEIVCQWDDDDLHHPERIERQVEHLLEHDAVASYLGAMVLQDVAGGRAWWVDHEGPDPVGRFLHGSLTHRRSHAVRYPEVGPHAIRGEDAVVALQVLRTRAVAVVPDAPWLYVYRYHGANTVTVLHVARLAARRAVPPRAEARASFHGLPERGGPAFDDLGTPESARAWYDEVLAGTPDTADARRHLAWEAAGRGDASTARALLVPMVLAGTADLTSLLALASLCRADGTLTSARPLLGPGLERYPQHPSAVAALGSLSVAEGRFDEALRCFTIAADLAPWDPVAANDRAVILARLGRTDEAIEGFMAVIDLDPARPAAHGNLCALLPSGRARVRAYEALAARHPSVAEVHERFAAVLAEAGATRRAHEVATRARRLRTP